MGRRQVKASNLIRNFIFERLPLGYERIRVNSIVAAKKKLVTQNYIDLWNYIDRTPDANGLSLSDEGRRFGIANGMNADQAQYGLEMVRAMLSGRKFAYYLNVDAARFFLEKISSRGLDATLRALAALKLHADYQRRTHGRAVQSQYKVITEYLFKLPPELVARWPILTDEKTFNPGPVAEKTQQAADNFAAIWKSAINARFIIDHASAKALADSCGMLEDRAYTALLQARAMIMGVYPSRYLNNLAADYFLEQSITQGVSVLASCIQSMQLSIDRAQAEGQPLNSRAVLVEKFLLRLAELDGARAEKFDLGRKVIAAQSLSSDERKILLEQGNELPVRRQVNTWVFERNANVVAERLYVAAGVCESCAKAAPFRRVDGTPYLEVHHLIPLSRGGRDILENTVALCPTCHRAVHYAHSDDLPPGIISARG